MEKKLILKNLHAVLTYAKERFHNEFIWQEVVLKENFKDSFRDFMESKGKEIEYFRHTSILTNRDGQQIYIANQWFAIASYFVDFCTELLTYSQYFERICSYLNISGSTQRRDYATRLKNVPYSGEKEDYLAAAKKILQEDFPESNEHDRIVGYLWRFVHDYDWWAGSKTVNRHDFHISPILNQLNVVNANAEFLAEIVLAYSSNLQLRRMVESLDNFTINIKKNTYEVSDIERESYIEAEEISIPEQNSGFMGISISAASLERFQANNK